MAKKKKQRKSTVLENVKALRQRGYRVRYVKRKDGGYRITSINGVKYSGAKGNTFASSITGKGVSPKQLAQMRYNVEKYIKLDPTKGRTHKYKGYVPNKIFEQLKDVQKVARTSTAKGKVDRPKIRYRYEHYGEKETEDFLKRRERYYQGYATERQIETLIARIEQVLNNPMLSSEEKRRVKNLIERIKNIEDFKNEWIDPINQYFYEIKKENFDTTMTIVENIIKS